MECMYGRAKSASKGHGLLRQRLEEYSNAGHYYHDGSDSSSDISLIHTFNTTTTIVTTTSRGSYNNKFITVTLTLALCSPSSCS